jgi:hypothetical protein
MRTTCPYHFNIFPVVHRRRIILRYAVIFLWLSCQTIANPR